MPAIDDPFRPRFHNSSATIARALFWSMIGCFVWTAAAIALAVNNQHAHDDPHGLQAVIMYGGIITGCFSFGLPLGYFAIKSTAKRTEKLRRAILDGKVLIHWRYPADQWRKFRQFAEKQEDKKLRQLRIGTGIFIVLPLIVGAIVGILQPGNDRAGINITVGMCGFFALVSAIILICGTQYDTRRRQRLTAPQDSFISPLGAHLNGRWVVWGTAQQKLRDIRANEGSDGAPAHMEFQIDNGQAQQCELVLIPAGQLELARKIVDAVKQSPEAAGGGGMNKATSVLQALTEVLQGFR